jgi:hypothetical protein
LPYFQQNAAIRLDWLNFLQILHPCWRKASDELCFLKTIQIVALQPLPALTPAFRLGRRSRQRIWMMRPPFHLVFALTLVTGCSDTPLIKSSDRARTYDDGQAPAATLAAQPLPQATAILPATAAMPGAGMPGYVVNCNGSGHTLRSCYEQADEICESQRHFVSNILKIEESQSGGTVTRSIRFRCNTEISYGNVGFPDNAQVPTLKKKPTVEQQLLLGK